MVNQILYPQEVEVFYVIPTIRKELARVMLKEGLEQKEIAKLLGVTEAAISQYLNEKRANEIKFNSSIKQEIANSVRRIRKSEDSIIEVQKILKLIFESRLICKYHRKFSKVPRGCAVCFEK